MSGLEQMRELVAEADGLIDQAMCARSGGRLKEAAARFQMAATRLRSADGLLEQQIDLVVSDHQQEPALVDGPRGPEFNPRIARPDFAALGIDDSEGRN